MTFSFVLDVDAFRNLPEFFSPFFFLIHGVSCFLPKQTSKKSISERSERDWWNPTWRVNQLENEWTIYWDSKSRLSQFPWWSWSSFPSLMILWFFGYSVFLISLFPLHSSWVQRETLSCDLSGFNHYGFFFLLLYWPVIFFTVSTPNKQTNLPSETHLALQQPCCLVQFGIMPYLPWVSVAVFPSFREGMNSVIWIKPSVMVWIGRGSMHHRNLPIAAQMDGSMNIRV